MRLLRLVSGRSLPCKCLIGVYETYAGPVVWILDARGDACTDALHQVGTRQEAPDEEPGATRAHEPTAV